MTGSSYADLAAELRRREADQGAASDASANRGGAGSPARVTPRLSCRPPLDVKRRLRELYERVTADGDGLLVGYHRAAQFLGSYGFQPRLVGKGGVLASRWTVARWLKAWRVPVLWWRIDGHDAKRLGLAAGRYPCVTRYMLLGAIFETAQWPLPRRSETDGTQATTPTPERPLPPPACRFTRDGLRQFGRPGRAA